ncbi:MAG: hypothetical protein ACPIOQ_56145, partial [Promethearchaeia archaeon]
ANCCVESCTCRGILRAMHREQAMMLVTSAQARHPLPTLKETLALIWNQVQPHTEPWGCNLAICGGTQKVV